MEYQKIRIKKQKSESPSSVSVFIDGLEIRNIDMLKLFIEPGKIPQLMLRIKSTDIEAEMFADSKYREEKGRCPLSPLGNMPV